MHRHANFGDKNLSVKLTKSRSILVGNEPRSSFASRACPSLSGPATWPGRGRRHAGFGMSITSSSPSSAPSLPLTLPAIPLNIDKNRAGAARRASRRSIFAQELESTQQSKGGIAATDERGAGASRLPTRAAPVRHSGPGTACCPPRGPSPPCGTRVRCGKPVPESTQVYKRRQGASVDLPRGLCSCGIPGTPAPPVRGRDPLTDPCKTGGGLDADQGQTCVMSARRGHANHG